MREHATRALRKWGYSWMALVAAFAIHVLDEALTDFLPFYNGIITSLRESYRFVPFPTFTYSTWLGALIIGVAVLALLSPLAFSGNRYFRYVSYAFAIVMLLNGMGHIAASIYLGAAAPGVLSSPLLLVAASALLLSTAKAQQASRLASQ